ncbi:MAG: T9SS type A sorting domain-containing protein, partial [Fidelibacterota bacterium]
TFVVDDCEDCVDPADFNGAMDCAGVCDGTFVVDDCEDCVDPADFNGAMDCAGVCDGSAYVDDCGVCDDNPGNDGSACAPPTDLTAEGGLNEVTLTWALNAMATYYNVYRDGELIGSTTEGSFVDGSIGFGLDYATEYCYTVSSVYTVENDGDYEGDVSEPVCATTLPYVLVGLSLESTNGENSTTIDVYMTNLLNVYGYQFDIAIDPAIAEVTDVTGLLTVNYANGTVIGFDFEGGFIAEGENQLLASITLGNYVAPWSTISVTVTPVDFSDESSSLNVCDMDFDQTNGCDISVTFDPPAADCMDVPGGSAILDDCGVCNGNNESMDCAGVCDGLAYEDDCGVCDDNPDNDNACFGVDVSIGVEAGWNWFSLNVSNDDMSLNTVLSNLGDDQVYIKNQSLFSEYYAGYGWFGGLENIGVTDFYMLQTLASGTITYNGMPVDAANTPIDLFTGWNWVGYTPQGAQDINTALGGIGENGVYVKNQTAFAEYYAGYGWFGGLETMSPFDGYMLQMTTDDVLTYPDTGPVLAVTESNYHSIQLLRDNAAEWQVNPNDYQYNGSVTAQIILEGGLPVSETDILAAFVGDECRGLASGQYFPLTDETVFMIMIYSNQSSGEDISFRFYDSSMDMYYGFNEGIEFQTNMTVGNAGDPYNMDSSYLLGVDDILPTEYALSLAYPNPFNPVTTLNYTVKELGDVNIAVFDMTGSKVDQLVNDRKAPGKYQVSFDAGDMPSGIYFVKMTCGDFTSMRKVMLVK